MSAPIEEHASEGAPEWMVSYADMITIMMAFFVVMYAMAGAKDSKKLQPAIASLHKQFGRFASGPAGPKVPRTSSMTGVGDGFSPRPSDGQAKKKSMPGEFSRVTMVRPGDQVTMGGVIWFDDDSVELTGEQQRSLDIAAAEMSGKPQKIEVRGHSESKPLADNAKYHDNWDLAYARCHATMEYLISHGIDSKRVRVSVAAQNEPLHTNNETGPIRRNGRVEIFMLNEFTDLNHGQPDAGDNKTEN